MKKQFKNAAFVGAAVLALTGAANAATIDLNIYGASAQFTFWNAAAPTFLTSVRNCAANPVQTTYTVASDTANTGKHEVTVGTGCDGATQGTGPNTINIRYSSKASYDGILAVKNADDYTTTTQQCASGSGQRKMILTGTTIGCQDVHVGASDVAGVSFTQQSHGQLLGPLGGGQTDRSFTAIPTTGLTSYQPVVVPFGFFANKSIQVATCASGTHAGNLCTTGTADVDCGTGALNSGSGLCTTNTISNISREMAVQIFSGNAVAWTDFGASYSVTGDATSSVVACLRHAGSGTHSTLDYAVMNSKWGGTLVTNESSVAPIVYFNDGSSDEMKCVNNNATLSTPGAIGYADSDQGLSSYTNTVALKYNGLLPRRNVIRNGQYDFYTNEWLFVNPNKVSTAQQTLINQLVAFSSTPANIPTSKKAYWATQAEMVWNKTNDQAYPAYGSATSIQTP